MDKVLVALRHDLNEAVEALRHSSKIDPKGKAGREVSLVITKLQEARLWAGEALKEMGYYNEGSAN